MPIIEMKKANSMASHSHINMTMTGHTLGYRSVCNTFHCEVCSCTLGHH